MEQEIVFLLKEYVCSLIEQNQENGKIYLPDFFKLLEDENTVREFSEILKQKCTKFRENEKDEEETDMIAFSRKMCKKIRKQNPDMSPQEVVKQVKAKWIEYVNTREH